MDLLDGAEDHRRGAPHGPAHQVPWAVAVTYLDKPLLDGTGSPSGLVVMSQQVRTLDSASGAGSDSELRMPASPRSPASMMAQEWWAISRHSMASACWASRRYRAPSSWCRPVAARPGGVADVVYPGGGFQQVGVRGQDGR